MIRTLLASTFLFLSTLGGAHAALELAYFFSDHMVLQQGDTAAIWGKAKPSEKVLVRFKGNVAKTRADEQGNWRTDIKTGPAQ